MRTRFVMVVGLLGCGGASESRVDTLAEQVNDLRAQQERVVAEAGASVAERIDTRATAAEQEVAALRERVQTLERELEALRKGTPTNVASAQAGSVSPQLASPAVDTARDAGYALDAILGLPLGSAVKVEGDTYSVRRVWLLEQFFAAAATAKLPKLVPDKQKAGIALRGIKPKSLLEALGFKNNDVVVAVAGKTTSNASELGQALKSAGNSTSVRVLRKNKDLVLQYTLID